MLQTRVTLILRSAGLAGCAGSSIAVHPSHARTGAGTGVERAGELMNARPRAAAPAMMMACFICLPFVRPSITKIVSNWV